MSFLNHLRKINGAIFYAWVYCDGVAVAEAEKEVLYKNVWGVYVWGGVVVVVYSGVYIVLYMCIIV